MKILIVSYSFPPENIIGAVRVGKWAKFLHERGHDVRVLAAPPVGDKSLPLEIPKDRIVYAKDWNVDALFDPLFGRLRKIFGKRAAGRRGASAIVQENSSSSRSGDTLKERLRWHYYALLRTPDRQAGWRKNATSAGYSLLSKWHPDLIFASTPPVTSLFVAAALGKRFRIPWVAELRDLWADNPYYAFPAWRRSIDRILERRLLGKAAMLVTVTPPWGQTLKASYDKSVAVILNGYAQEDYPSTVESGTKPPGILSIVYTGNIYRGFRDPSALFAAVRRLPSEERASIVVDFYGPSVAEVKDLVQHHEVADSVRVHAAVSYRDSLRLQRDADVLLLLQWNDPRDAGNIPAKFFEYVAAGRPILLLGYAGGTLAQMIREREAGVVSNDPEVVAAHLSTWIAMRRNGGIPGLSASAKAGLARGEQFEKLEKLLASSVSCALPTAQ